MPSQTDQPMHQRKADTAGPAQVNEEEPGNEVEDSGGDDVNFDHELSYADTEETRHEGQCTTPKKTLTKAPKRQKHKGHNRFNAARADDRYGKQMMPQLQQKPQQRQEGEDIDPPLQNDGKKNPLKLRLDLNLDIEITLKAKIHGDVTLTLL